MPSDAEIKAMMDKQRKGMQLPSSKASVNMASEQAQGRAAASTVAPVPAGTFKAEVPRIAAPAVTRTESLDDVMRRYNEAKGGAPQARTVKGIGSDLAIFVSFSMPKEVIQELARQAKETGAVLILRGFKDKSLRKTKQAAFDANAAGAPWEIHPELFKAFKVTKVPTFVVATSEASSVLEDGCAPDTTYASVSGNISIELALDTIRMRAKPQMAKLAAARLASIRKANEQPRLQ